MHLKSLLLTCEKVSDVCEKFCIVYKKFATYLGKVSNVLEKFYIAFKKFSTYLGKVSIVLEKFCNVYKSLLASWEYVYKVM